MKRPSAVAGQPFEAARVELVRVDVQPVPALYRPQRPPVAGRPRLQLAAELGHVRLQGLGGRRWRLALPDHAHPVFAGLAADPEAGQEWRDLFTRLRSPSEVFTAERQDRWVAAWRDRPSAPAGASHG